MKEKSFNCTYTFTYTYLVFGAWFLASFNIQPFPTLRSSTNPAFTSSAYVAGPAEG